MMATRKPRSDSSRLAVIRKYEPTRIERELLARVFDVVAHGVNSHRSGLDEGEGMLDDVAQSCDGLEFNSVASTPEQRERAA